MKKGTTTTAADNGSRQLVDTTNVLVLQQQQPQPQDDPQVSPTGVAEDLTTPKPSWHAPSSSEQPSAEDPASGFSPSVWLDSALQQATTVLQTVQLQVDQAQKRLTWDRPLVMTCLLAILAAVLAVAVATLGGMGAVALVTCPLWLPVAVLTAPVWLCVLLVSSPVWVAVVLAVGAAVISGTAVVLFFGWPQEWLPSPKQNRTVAGFLDARQRVELYLIKAQAKLLLYAAGVGPAADAAFLIIDRIDLRAVRQRLSEMDLEKLKHLDVSELQSLLLEAVANLVK